MRLNNVFNPNFKIRLLKNKAQIARESIEITLELPGPLPKVSSVLRS